MYVPSSFCEPVLLDVLVEVRLFLCGTVLFLSKAEVRDARIFWRPADALSLLIPVRILSPEPNLLVNVPLL